MAVNLKLSNLTNTRPFDPNNCYPWSNMKRVILAPDGTEIGTLHDDNSNNWADGTAVNWTEVEANGWNVMVRIPKFWFGKKPYNIDGSYDNGHIWIISDKPEDGLELHPAFMRCRDKLSSDLTGVVSEVNTRYFHAFLPTVINNKLRSLPNKVPVSPITLATSRTYAEANGTGWGLVDFHLLFAVQLLYVVEYGNYDSQTTIGRGYLDGTTAKTNTGGTLIRGNKSYGETTGKQQMSYRGIEDLWGNLWFLVDGAYSDGSRNILITNKGFNNAATGYINIGQAAAADIRNFISNIHPSPTFGFIAKAVAGTATSKFFDAGVVLSSGILMAGGAYGQYWANSNEAGITSMAFGLGVTESYGHIGASLSY